MTTCYTSLCFDVSVVFGVFFCLWVGNPWFGTGLLSCFYDCLKYLGGLAITGLDFLFL